MNETRGLWRGKRIDDGEWVSGDMSRLISKNRYYIEDNQEDWVCEVDPSTLGECTGLTDKNGKLIFEGDIVKIRGKIGRALFVDDEAGFIIDTDETYFTMSYSSECEVMGNIHDNTELLKGEANENT